MLNLVELGSYHLPLILLSLKCVLSYFQEKIIGFDKKEDFRSSFKEDRKSNEASKKCRKQDEAVHGRAPGSTAMLQWPGPRRAVRHSTAMPTPNHARFYVFAVI